jgi:cholesterol oxidase
MTMPDTNAIVIGSGFGGAVTGWRLTEAGYKVMILERGRHWTYDRTDTKLTPYPRVGDDIGRWIWDHSCPERLHGWIDFRVFPKMTVVQGAGVGGGSLIYANVSVRAPRSSFATGWPAGFDWCNELEPHYQTVGEMLNVMEVPVNQWSGRTWLLKEAAEKLGQPDRFKPLELAVYFGDQPLDWKKEPVEPDNPQFRENKYKVKQAPCYHRGQCDIGCPVNARNTLDTNYLAAAREKGASIRPLHLVSHIEPTDGGYRVHYRNLENSRAGSLTAEIVILAAGSLGSTELLLRSRDVTRTLPRVSARLGRGWSSNGDFLTPAYYSHRDVYPSTGVTISSVIDFLDGSRNGQHFWVQDGGLPDLLASTLKALGSQAPRWLRAIHLLDFLKVFLARSDPAHHVMPWFAQGVDASNGTLRLKRCCWLFGPKRLHLDWDTRKSQPLFDEILRTHKELAELTGGRPEPSLAYTLFGDLITPHPLGGCNMGTTEADGVVDEAGQVFNYPNLYVADGAVIPRAIGVNPSRTIAAVAERTARRIVEKGKRA